VIETTATHVVEAFEAHLRGCGWLLAVETGSRAVTVRDGPTRGCMVHADESLADILLLADVTRDLDDHPATGRGDLPLLETLDALAVQAPGARLLLSGSEEQVVVELELADPRGGAVPLGRGPDLGAALVQVTRFLRAMPATSGAQAPLAGRSGRDRRATADTCPDART